jgi:hypothetical protein
MNRPEKITVQVPDRKRNPVAAQLSDAQYRVRQVPSVKTYKRRTKHQIRYSG